MAKEREVCFGPLLRRNNTDSINKVLWLHAPYFFVLQDLSLNEQVRMLDDCQFNLICETEQKR